MPIVTERDRAILWSLGTTRVLSAQEIEWLHFPGWEEREYIQHTQAPHEAVRRSPGVHRRLSFLQKIGFVQTMFRPALTSDRRLANPPLLRCLTQRGKAHLRETVDQDVEALWAYPVTQQASADNMEHSYLIGRLYAALVAGSARDGHQLTAWEGDHLLAKGYDRLAVPGYREPLPMLPDATGLLVTEGLYRRFFVEVDRGTMAVARWRDKIAAQHAYRGSQALQARYGGTTFFTCIVAPSQTRLRRIAEAVAHIAREPSYAFLFTCLDQIHPTTIRACWQRISAIRWEHRHGENGGVDVPCVTFAPVGLWKASATPAATPAVTPAATPVV